MVEKKLSPVSFLGALLFSAVQCFAGGLDINGNGTQFREFITQAAANCKIIANMKTGLGSTKICPGGGNACTFSIDSLKATKVTFSDGFSQTIVPISYRPADNCGSPCTKQRMTFIGRGDNGKLFFDTRELTVDSQWDHENVYNIQWKSATDSKQYKVTSFAPTTFSINDIEKNSLLSTVQKNPDSDDLKGLSCEAAAGPAAGTTNGVRALQ